MGDNMKLDRQKLLSAILNASGTKINKNALEQAKKGDIGALSAPLDEQSRKMLGEVMSDKNKMREILNSDAAKEIIKKFSGDKNG
ncbi:MAG: hypothetical protein J5852_03255 [Clostridia bacterium]|nr:hypothetical protein [Clostridia bacterium]